MKFETYVQESRPALLRLAVVLSNDPELAQDVVQDVLLRAGEQWARIDGLHNRHAYVWRMVANQIISTYRRWGRVQATPAAELDGAAADPFGIVDRREAILRELARLPIRQRSAVVLRYFEDLSDEQIGAILGCRPATVRAHLHRALKTLRVDATRAALNPVR